MAYSFKKYVSMLVFGLMWITFLDKEVRKAHNFVIGFPRNVFVAQTQSL